jgi:hypothetical protein
LLCATLCFYVVGWNENMVDLEKLKKITKELEEKNGRR